MKNKKFLSMILAAAVICSFVGCQADKGEVLETSQVMTTTSVVTEQTSETVEMKTIEPPEDGWTLEELLDVTYVYGHKLKLPCKIGDLLAPFSYNTNDGVVFEEDNSIGVILEYNKEPIGSMNVENCSNLDDISSDKIVKTFFLSIFLNDKNKNNIYINGTSLSDSKDVVLKNLGKPDRVEKNNYTYCDSNDNEILIVNFSEDNEVFAIMFASGTVKIEGDK